MVVLQKKLSIPATISLILKYIPELQKEVDGLMLRKEEMQLKMSRASSRPGDVTVTPQENATSFPTVSARHIGDREVLIQICTTTWGSSPVSKALEKMEEEGFHLLHASSFTTAGNKVFYNLHLQVPGLISIHPYMGQVGPFLGQYRTNPVIFDRIKSIV